MAIRNKSFRFAAALAYSLLAGPIAKAQENAPEQKNAPGADVLLRPYSYMGAYKCDPDAKKLDQGIWLVFLNPRSKIPPLDVEYLGGQKITGGRADRGDIPNNLIGDINVIATEVVQEFANICKKPAPPKELPDPVPTASPNNIWHIVRPIVAKM